MKTLEAQYINEIQDFVVTLDQSTLSVLYGVCFRIAQVRREYDLNSEDDVIAAELTRHPLPFKDPDTWLSLSEFLTVIFQVYGVAHGDDR